MTQPQAYNRETDFTERDGDDTNHAGINTELDAAALSINQIRENLALIQRDDGGLQNGIVTADALAPSAFDAFKVDLNEAVTDAQTAAASANNAALSANTARDQAVAAKDTAVTSANAAALNATTATTKATEAASSATASATSATNSATSATSSANSATTATTKAAEAATSATNSASSASSASTSAGAAATSETNAGTSAATATTQAGIATTQANNASASAAAAAASFDQFEDRYLGSKTADPTTDNDGNALLSGALYFNSVAGEMRVWADTFWKATGSSVGGTINTAKYTATAGQTTFAIVYDVGFVHVYLNGIKLESGVDFTANNGTSVVLATGATAGDVVDMIAFGIFSVANTYTKTEADALLATKAPQATTYTKTEVDTADALKLNAANPSYTGTLTGGTGVVNLGSGHFYKDASGNVGIGTSSPLSKLDVVGSGNYDGVVSVRSTGTNTPRVALGVDAVASAAGYVGTVNNLPFQIRTNDTTRATFDSNGNLLVGTTSSSYGKLEVAINTTANNGAARFINNASSGYTGELVQMISSQGASTAYNILSCYYSGGGAYAFKVRGDGTIYAQNTTVQSASDARFKENIVDSTEGLSVVSALRPVRFDIKEGNGLSAKTNQLGFIAQEVQAVFPDAVDVWGESDDPENPYLSLGATALIPVLVKAIQEQQALIQQLKADVAALKAAT